MWQINTIWFDITVVMSIFAVGSILFGHFEEHKPKWRRLLKIAIVLAIFLSLVIYAGRVWGWGDENVRNCALEDDPVFVPYQLECPILLAILRVGTKMGSGARSLFRAIFITPVWGYLVLAIPLLGAAVIHLWWLPKHGINGWTGEPREKYYELLKVKR